MKDVRADLTAVSLAPSRHGTIADYIHLTKPRLNLLVVASCAAGYYLGSSEGTNLTEMTLTVAGTALVAAGAAVFNQLLEQRTDGLMRRTRGRALPDGRVSAGDAGLFGSALSAGGLALLMAAGGFLAASLALATLVTYIGIYTPLKRRSPIATVVGAVPGALPPLIGWTASHGSISAGGVALFGIVFFWQIPHFMAIAWMYRDDYAKAGFPMLPVLDPTGRRAARQAVMYAAALLPMSTVPVLVGLSGHVFLYIALLVGTVLFWLAARFASQRTDDSARLLFLGSIAYLPILWIAMIANRL
ncbi:MAG TPA: heme o synthase [Vicinamibacterales bacterium]|nr:heme o synthase [Vicinamibacterales bacterium]